MAPRHAPLPGLGGSCRRARAQEIKRIRRLSERTIQNERRVSGLEPGNVVRATATFALEPELERIRAIVSAAAESALAAQAEAHEEAQRRMVETLTRLEACARSLGALRAAGARAGADAAGEGAESAAAEGAAPADAAAAELEVRRAGRAPSRAPSRAASLRAHAHPRAPRLAAQALRAELAAERERSAALELTCAQLIKGATSSYHAPKGGAKRIDQRLEAQPAVHGARLSKAFAGHPYSTEDTTLYTPAHTAGAAQPAQPQRTGSEDGAPAGGAREGADATPADSVDLAGGDEAAPRLAQEDSGGEERAAEAGGEGGAQPADAEAEREQQQDGYEGGRAAQHESEGESDDGALM